MRKRILNLSLSILLAFICTINCYAQSLTRLDNITITELKNSIQVHLKSNDNINYNIINYMNGDIGISLQDTSLGSRLEDNENLRVSQQNNIDIAQLYQNSPDEVLVKISGNNIDNKSIKVENEIKKSNFILIETEDSHREVANLPVMTEPLVLPDIQNFEVKKNIRHKQPETVEPISMFSIKDGKFEPPKIKNLIAQARTYEDDTSILDLGDDLFSDDKKETTEKKAEKPELTKEEKEKKAASAIKEEPPKNLDPEKDNNELAKDIINIDVEEGSKPAENRTDSSAGSEGEPGILAKAWNFVATNWVWFAGGGGCLIVGFIILAVLGSVMQQKNMAQSGGGQQQQQQPQQDPGQQQPQGEVPPPVADDDPVEFVAPANHKSSQSVSEAINHIISIRDMTGR